MQASITGIADFVDDNIEAQLHQVKTLLEFLPSNAYENPPLQEPAEPMQPMPEIPLNPKLPFNMTNLIAAIVDNSTFIHYKRTFGQAMICAFAHINGYPVGIVANQSMRMSGAIDSDAAQKSARFIRICEAYNIPLITLIDVPGFMPGKREEQKGLLKHGAKLCAAMQTTVPRISVVIRKCYGAAAFLLMQTKSQGGDLVLALETATIGVMGKETTTSVKKIDQSSVVEGEDKSESSLEAIYSMGLIDEIIAPSQIRKRLAEHLEYLRRKHEPRGKVKKSISD